MARLKWSATSEADRNAYYVGLISKRLRKFYSYTELIGLARRLFQKDLSVLEELEEALQAVSDHLKVVTARNRILKLIASALDKRLRNPKGLLVKSLPSCPENYISFCHLAEISAHPQRKTWHTFVLQDQSEDGLDALHGPNGSLPLFKIRKRVKKQLSDQYSTSVQMEHKTSSTTEMVFLRIATTKKTKVEANDLKRLLTAKPTYLVYFPGEHYFYADSLKPNPEHCQVNTLNG